MKQIDALELMEQGYKWDQDWQQQLGRACGWPGALLLLLFLGAGAGLVFELLSPATAAVIMVSSGAVLILLTLVVYRSSPTSPATGRRLVKYRNRSPLTPGAITEVIYVDHETRKFFVYAWIKNAEDHLDVG